MNKTNPYANDLEQNDANYAPLSPITFIRRASEVYPNRCAVIYGEVQRSWRETYQRCCQLASALNKIGIGSDDTVALMLPNVPAMLEAHFAIPMAGGVINALNIRLDSDAIAFMLEHGNAKVLLTDKEFSSVVERAVAQLSNKPIIIDVDDVNLHSGKSLGKFEYEAFLASGDKNFDWQLPENEWQAIALGYTSGTTGNPKGVVTHHRGAHLNSLSNILAWNMTAFPTYLWTLPMFHCNGWCFPWVVAALNGTHVCLRAVVAEDVFKLVKQHRVSHLCGAPIVLNMLSNAPQEVTFGIEHSVNVMTAGSAPPPSVLEAMVELGFNVTHTYGLTEVYGPAVVCSWHEEWDELPTTEQAALKARQGVRYPMLEELKVMDPDTMTLVPCDGETIGEIMFKGNVVMKGYLDNPSASNAAFDGGYFHSGDLAVCHPDGYIEIKDRSKDIIISGGENISSIEVEATLYRHPAILEAAVVAMPHEKWGEAPCAFVTLHEDAAVVSEQEIIDFCQLHMARFKAPKRVVFGSLPKTSTGKVQKFELRQRL